MRELEEETGWTADHAEVLMIGPTSSGASSEKIAFVRATGLRRVGEGGGDDSEDITVHSIARDRAAAWLVEKMGQGYELDAIAAVVLGGTSLSGGVGSVWGTVIGALIIGVMNNGLTILGLSSFWQYVAKGAVIVLAVLLDKWRQQHNSAN